ncbi:hypothetical protein B0H67DRAFT_231649 [Lasiosphaeris hirsuta]|uniref:Uncharacterized protein n=1 Tax=Lasiosphaeris hirsuta TaxID=260670 RepID=A0AA40AFR1_9PEZI|nr:hypothetical protein B0H67DRAFT_231649 [Lasiosphaeris hirsuta]
MFRRGQREDYQHPAQHKATMPHSVREARAPESNNQSRTTGQEQPLRLLKVNTATPEQSPMFERWVNAQGRSESTTAEILLTKLTAVPPPTRERD